MKILQKAILEKGIENVQIQFITDVHWTGTENPICNLAKYWDDDDYSGYVHKIKVVENKPYIIKTIMGETEYPPKYNSYYMCDLEQYFKDGSAIIL